MAWILYGGRQILNWSCKNLCRSVFLGQSCSTWQVIPCEVICHIKDHGAWHSVTHFLIIRSLAFTSSPTKSLLYPVLSLTPKSFKIPNNNVRDNLSISRGSYTLCGQLSSANWPRNAINGSWSEGPTVPWETSREFFLHFKNVLLQSSPEILILLFLLFNL